MNCPKCNNVNSAESKYCATCGKRLQTDNAFVALHKENIDEPTDPINSPIVLDHIKPVNKKKGLVDYITTAITIVVCIVVAGLVRGYFQALREEPHTTQNVNNNQESANWIEFKSIDDGFKVLLPKQPTLDSKEATLPNTQIKLTANIYSVLTDNGVDYTIFTSVDPDWVDTSNTQKFFDDVVNGSVSALDGALLVSSNIATYHNYRAVDYVIDDVKYKSTLYQRSFLVGQRLYTLMVSNQTGVFNGADYDKFINSFEIY